jgi:hypothetical protein
MVKLIEAAFAHAQGLREEAEMDGSGLWRACHHRGSRAMGSAGERGPG